MLKPEYLSRVENMGAYMKLVRTAESKPSPDMDDDLETNMAQESTSLPADYPEDEVLVVQDDNVAEMDSESDTGTELHISSIESRSASVLGSAAPADDITATSTGADVVLSADLRERSESDSSLESRTSLSSTSGSETDASTGSEPEDEIKEGDGHSTLENSYAKPDPLLG
jgi:hypothetical protein